MGNLKQEALALLEWYAEAGVDEAIDEAAHDRFAETAEAAARRAAEREAPARSPAKALAEPVAPAPPAEPVVAPPAALAPKPDAARPARPVAASPATASNADAQAMAAKATTLGELEQAVRGFEGCSLKATAKNTCFADGNPDGGIMFIGEGPGRDEDIQGKPFVGRAGQLLDRMMAAIDLDRSCAYISNIVFWRPPGNRTPTPAEADTCRPFTDRQIDLAQPKLIVFLGGAAAKQMLGRSEGIMRLRGKWTSYRAGDREIRAIATLHPAFLLRQPLNKRLAWQDFLEIRAAMDELGIATSKEERADAGS